MIESSVGEGNQARLWTPCWTVALLLSLAVGASAQTSQVSDVRQEAFAGSDIEEYLRVMQGAGAARWYPWSIRGLSPVEVERMALPGTRHPWAERYRFLPDDTTAGVGAGWVSPGTKLIFNSAFPHGANDGAVWAGRGLTSVVRGGGWARLGPLSLVAAPIAFRAENASFDLAPNGQLGLLTYGDWRSGGTDIDLPQRFGNGAYWRLSPGQSTLRLDLGPVAAAVSTANQYWGPATEHPLLLGNNAEGYPHLLVGTSRPVDVGFGLVHGRLVYGRLAQSRYSPVQDSSTARFMSGFVGLLRPRGLPGLEIGAARFFHSPWPDGGPGLRQIAKPLEGLLKVRLERDESGEVISDVDNQLASVFLRWLVPNSGFEVYGEYAREDHSWDLRDLLLEPDHDSAYLLGARRVWGGDPERWTVLRGELLNAEISHLFRVRPQTRFYRHTRMRQGHTERGQILGSAAAFGGAASELAIDRYHPAGRWTLGWSRAVHERSGRYWEEGTTERNAVDTSHALEAEVLWFRGPIEILSTLGGVYRFNRYFAEDVFNLTGSFGVSWRP